MIKLTERDGAIVWVNPRRVCTVNEHPNQTFVTFDVGGGNFISVVESAEDVAALIDAALS